MGVQARGRGFSDSSPLRLGVLGTGQRGSQLLAVARDCPGVCIAALVDGEPQSLARARRLARPDEPRVGRSLSLITDMAAGSALDALIIATPPHLHAEQAVEALRAGLHVYLEKPLALTAGDCHRVYDEAIQGASRGQVFQIGFQRRYSPRYRAAVEAVRRGQAGEVRFIRAQWHTTGDPGRRKPWYHRRELSGDSILEQACHQIDVFNWVYGSTPLRACGLGGVRSEVGDASARCTRDHFALVLEYPGGGKVELSQFSGTVPDRRFSGVYELIFGERLGIDPGNGLAWDRQGKVVELGPSGGNETRLAFEGFVGHIRAGEPSRAGIRVAVEATLAAILGREALDSGRVVAWDEWTERGT